MTLLRVVLSSGSLRLYATAVAQRSGIDKEALVQLRKRTGYSFFNCRKALKEFGPENLAKAEQWLHELAKKEGWEKAAQMSDRIANHGLVAIATSGPVGALVELQCETDFVVNSPDFRAMVESLGKTCLNDAVNEASSVTDQLLPGKITRFQRDPNDTMLEGGRMLKELLALQVRMFKEKIGITKLEMLYAPKDSWLFSYAHPREFGNAIPLGRMAAVVAIRSQNGPSTNPEQLEKIGQQLCQHIVGMKPLMLGTPFDTSSSPTVSRGPARIEDHATTTADSNDDPSEVELHSHYSGPTTELNDDEEVLLRQQFMLNPGQTVHEFVASNGVAVIDYLRLEHGQPVV